MKISNTMKMITAQHEAASGLLALDTSKACLDTGRTTLLAALDFSFHRQESAVHAGPVHAGPVHCLKQRHRTEFV